MSVTLAFETVRAAQDNDLAATTAVLEATEGRVSYLSEKAARRFAPYGGDRYMDAREEFAQIARIAVWEALPRFTGETVDAFFAFIYSTAEGKLTDALRDMRHGNAGADKDAIKVFASMLDRADGDVFLAAKLAQTVPPKGQRLSADRAEAARLAWEGDVSIHAPMLSANAETPGNFSVALDAVLQRVAPLDVPDDLVEAADLNREDRRVKLAIVNAILDVMGEGQRVVIKHSFGIGDVLYFGHGDSGDDEGMSAVVGMPVKAIREARSKGLKAFAKRYVNAIAGDDPELADKLTAAAAANLSRGGRK
ncbi:sigma factor [Streptomyces sp. NPDC056486]|uniref:sigma factor n=1 Tax=Streptomyces sp. NPDC056486 TaxID=3345835 RepID=UPI0036C1299A